MEVLVVEGEKYVKASSIARDLGYTSDYVGQLCRSGKVEAQLVGRSWYVKEDSIKNHKATRYRSTKKSTQKAIKNSVALDSNIPRSFEAKLASYEEDGTELIPLTNSSPALETDDRTLTVPLHSESLPGKAREQVQVPPETPKIATTVSVTHMPSGTAFKPAERPLPKFKGVITVAEEMTESADETSAPETEIEASTPELVTHRAVTTGKKRSKHRPQPLSHGSLTVHELDPKTATALPIWSTVSLPKRLSIIQLAILGFCLLGMTWIASTLLIQQTTFYTQKTISHTYSIDFTAIKNKLIK